MSFLDRFDWIGEKADLLERLDRATSRANNKDAEAQRESGARIDAERKWTALNHEYSVAQAKIQDIQKRNRNLLKEHTRIEAENQNLRERVILAERRFDETNQKLIDALTTAGDSMSVRATGRTLFTRSPVQPPPQEMAQEQIAFGGRVLASDIAALKTKQFYQKLAREAGVINNKTAPQEPQDDSEPVQ